MWRHLLRAFALAILACVLVVAYLLRAHWLPSAPAAQPAAGAEPAAGAPTKVLLTGEQQQRLGIVAAAVRPGTFWRTVELPGVVVDRPGRSDRAVVAPIAAFVSAIHRLPGEAVRPGEPLVTLRLVSESVHQVQSDLYRAAQELKLAQAQRQRLVEAGGLGPPGRLIEADSQIARFQVAVRVARQDLLARGLSAEQADAAGEGNYAQTMTLSAPTAVTGLEVQELKAELGQQVQPGQALVLLADHSALLIEGRAFPDEVPLLEWSARQGWPVAVDLGTGFAGDAEAIALLTAGLGVSRNAWTTAGLLGLGAAEGWFGPEQRFVVQRIGNTLDTASRTLAFQVPLVNQSRPADRPGGPTLWRYRPGQAARLYVRAERFDGVFAVPSAAVAREGADSIVFVQNVNTFERVPVRVLHQERRQVVLAAEGELLPGSFVVQAGAEVLARMLKAQSTTVPKGYHVHADGSLHRNEDEGK